MVKLYHNGGDAGDFSTIQSAIDAAQSGDTIVVESGSYTEDLSIDVENLTIEGANAGNPGTLTVRSSESILAGGINITAGGVTIDGFSITASLPETFNPSSINVHSDNVLIQNNVITADADAVVGVSVDVDLNGVVITANAIIGFNAGVYVNPEDTVAAVVTDNVFSDNLEGLVFEADPSVSDVSGNQFSGSGLNDIRVSLRTAVTVDLTDVVTSNLFTGGDIGTVFVRAAGLSHVTGTVHADHMEAATAGVYANIGSGVEFHGGAGNDTLVGSVSDDMLYGDSGSDTINGGNGADLIVTAEAGVQEGDTVNAGMGDDQVFAGATDIVDGGIGNDELTIDFRNGDADQSPIFLVLSGAGTGFASDGTSITGFEQINLDLTGGDDFTFTGNVEAHINGNGGDDRIVSGSAADMLSGGAGNDTLDAGAGIDFLCGGIGNDTLRGGIGADVMTGGIGDDLFFVDNGGDGVIEEVGGGNDTVSTSVSYALAVGQEVETIRVTDAASTAALNINGNAFNQTIIGNDGVNVLNGGGGIDVLSGLGGNDRYLVTDSGDRILEAAGNGNDTVFSTVSLAITAGQEIEKIAITNAAGTTALNLNGNEFAQSITGNDGANALNGGAGSDVVIGLGGSDRLFGGLGNDLLTGGTGNDLFLFNTTLGASNVDVIADFSNLSGNNDTVYLDDAVFTALTPGALGGAFAANTAGAAQELDDRIIYESDTGKLFYDADGTGSGASVLFASLTGHPTLTVSDFVVF